MWYMYMLLLVSATKRRQTGYVNDYDDKIQFSVNNDEFICGMRSRHNNHKEDRKFDFYACSYPEDVTSPQRTDEHWTDDYCGDYGKEAYCKCSDGYGVVGMYSTHSNHKEDRKWKLLCAKITGATVTTDCEQTAYINEYDKDMDYKAADDQVVHGIYSRHSNHKEDRKWQLMLCKLEFPATTQATAPPPIKMSGAHLLGVGYCYGSVNWEAGYGWGPNCKSDNISAKDLCHKECAGQGAKCVGWSYGQEGESPLCILYPKRSEFSTVPETIYGTRTSFTCNWRGSSSADYYPAAAGFGSQMTSWKQPMECHKCDPKCE